MIIKAILTVLFTIAELLLNMIPAFPTIEKDVDFSWLVQLIRILNQFIDLKTVGILMSVWIAVMLVFFFWSLFNWIIHKIPGVS